MFALPNFDLSKIDPSKFHPAKIDPAKFDLSTSVRRVRAGASRLCTRYLGGVVTAAIAASLVTGAIVTDEPADADGPVAAQPAAEAVVEEPTETEAAAEAPVEAPVVEPPAPEQVAPEPVAAAPEPPPAPVYEDNLDGWIREALDILAAHNIPASYDGIMRNVMRESSGNPQAINLWDSNAAAGIPSKGLLQVIDPTYAAYHVEGTVYDIWDPVSNIVAACNYAAHRYGSIDNVYGPY